MLLLNKIFISAHNGARERGVKQVSKGGGLQPITCPRNHRSLAAACRRLYQPTIMTGRNLEIRTRAAETPLTSSEDTDVSRSVATLTQAGVTELRVGDGEQCRNVLIAVGKREATNCSIQWALENIVQPGDVLHLVECIPSISHQDHMYSLPFPVPLEPASVWEQQIQPSWERHIEEVYGQKLKASKVAYQLHLVQDNSTTTKEGTAVALVKEADRLKSDIIVLASTSRGGLSELIHGSVANVLTHRSTKPVAVLHTGTLGASRSMHDAGIDTKWRHIASDVLHAAASPPTASEVHSFGPQSEEAGAENEPKSRIADVGELVPESETGSKTIAATGEQQLKSTPGLHGRNILVADDGSQLTLECCKWTMKYLMKPGDTLQLVHVIPCLPPNAPMSGGPFEYEIEPLGWPTGVTLTDAENEEKAWKESQTERFKAIMEEADKSCKFDTVQIVTIVDYTVDPVITISQDLCRTATSLDAKAVVMAAHQHGTAAELIFGSIANSVAHHCEQPVVLLPAGQMKV